MNHACLQKVILFCCRDFYLIPKGEELLDKHFPGESRIPLLEMETNVSLGLHYGHPLLLDGMRPVPNENFAFENLRILRVFSKFDGGFEFFENVKKTEQLRAPFSSAIAEDPKKYRLTFLTVFDKSTGHKDTKFCPEYIISITYKSYFIIFSVTRKIFFGIF